MTDAMPHQATCVAIDARALLIEGPPGSGKSSLALALLDRARAAGSGALIDIGLVGDDSLLLEVQGGRLWARPHPRTRGLLEVRNLGLLRFPEIDVARVSLLVTLDHEAPRFIEAPESAMRGGIAVPHIRLWPDSPVLAQRAMQALQHYGLP